MNSRLELRCVLCGRSYPPDAATHTCASCGLDGTLDVLYDLDEVRRSLSREGLARDFRPCLWRYAPLLPVEEEPFIPPLAVGWSPLYRSDLLARRYGIKAFYVKDDGRNPTGSLKDRASAVGVARARELGQSAIACASTGNAASSLAGFSTVAGLPAYIFVPESAPEGKVAQLLIYGATVVLVRGDYAAAFDLATAAMRQCDMRIAQRHAGFSCCGGWVKRRARGRRHIANRQRRPLPNSPSERRAAFPVCTGCRNAGRPSA